MNKSVDERLVPNGEYIDALNVRLGSTEETEVGSVENSKGNTILTEVEYNSLKLSDSGGNITSAYCIGVYEDGANETIYWFITATNATPTTPPGLGSTVTGKMDFIMSYNVSTTLLTYHIISINDGTGVTTRLNFNSKYLITGVNVVDNMLFFTDDYNPPRKININKNYPNPSGAGIDGFIANDILVIKAPPIYTPSFTMVNNNSTDNFLEDRFICFAYRYKYADGEYSATSQFSDIAFVAKPFAIDVSSYLNSGMTNLYNMAQVQVYTGDSLVKGIDLLFKEADGSIIRVIEKLDKAELGIADSIYYQFEFDNSKIYTILPSSEILRLYDNVPRFAKAQSVMGNRLMYGNYIDGYNLKDANNQDIKLEYFTDLVSTDITLTPIDPANVFTVPGVDYQIDGVVGIADSQLNVDLTGMPLVAGTTFSITLTFIHSQFTGGPPLPAATTPLTTITFTFVLQQTFASIYDMGTDVMFENTVGTSSNIQPMVDACTGATFTDRFNCVLPDTLGTYDKTNSGIIAPLEPILLTVYPTSNVVSLKLLAAGYHDTTAGNSCFEYFKIESASASWQTTDKTTSLHSDRDYEVGIVYMDSFLRATTALVSPDNTLHIPCENSDVQNTIKVTIPVTMKPPSWAERYKFVVKANKSIYENVFSNFFYPGNVGNIMWFLLEGDNSTKVEKGDKLRVKADTHGALGGCVYTTVLEKEVKQAGFIDNTPGALVPPQGGVYIKIRPKNFAVNNDVNATKEMSGTVEENTGGDFPTGFFSCSDGPAPFVDWDVPEGSKIQINIKFERIGNVDNPPCDPYCYDLVQSYDALATYANFEDFWIQQVDINSGTQCSPGFTINNSILPSVASASAPTAPSPTANINKYRFWRNTTAGNNELFLSITSGGVRCSGAFSASKRRSRIRVDILVQRASQLVAFETMPNDTSPDIFYEGSQNYNIHGGYHISGSSTGDQNQTAVDAGIVNLAFFDCIAFGNGVESYKIEDSLIGKSFNLGNRTTLVSAQDYKEADRFADITYSGVYNDESNVNKLNEFNLGLLNFLPLEESFGEIQILYGRETDILTLQEDKISYVTVGKNILTDAVGGGAVTSVPQVLGQQVARLDEFGISNNPESFVVYGYDKFFTDAKRGAVIQLKGSAGANESLGIISEAGMRPWFRDLFLTDFDTQKLGGFDPYMNEYVLSSNNIKVPSSTECIACGVTQNVTVQAAETYSFCVDAGTTVGNVNIPYTFAVGDSGTIQATYNAVTVTTGVVSGSGTLVVNKNLPAVETISVVITPSGGDATLRLSVDCPIPEALTVIQICITSNVEAGQFIHNEYRYIDGAYVSPLISNLATFVSGTATPLVSQYDSVTGVQGDGFCPTDGSAVSVICNKTGFDDFVFDTTLDRFLYLRSNTLYNNTPGDITTLLAAAIHALPLIVSAAPAQYSADFTMPAGTDDYLYLIYDYRNSVEYGLCYDAASTVDVCCVCSHFWYLVRNTFDATEEYYAQSPVALVIGTYYSLIGMGTTKSCFEIISTTTNLPTKHINAPCIP